MGRLGRPPKPRESILTPEQITAIQNKGLTPAQQDAAERRKKDADRKRLERQSAKIIEQMSALEDIHQFWAESRKLADPQKLVEWQARQEYVKALLVDLHTVLEDRSPDPKFIRDVDDELKADIAEFGQTGVTPILIIGKFWQESNLLAQLTSGDSPNAIFAKFGILVALPDLKIHQWNEFVAAEQPAKAQPGNGFTTLQCTSCNAITGAVSVPTSIRDRYIELGIPFRCQRCRDLERKSRAQSTLYGGSR